MAYVTTGTVELNSTEAYLKENTVMNFNADGVNVKGIYVVAQESDTVNRYDVYDTTQDILDPAFPLPIQSSGTMWRYTREHTQDAWTLDTTTPYDLSNTTPRNRTIFIYYKNTGYEPNDFTSTLPIFDVNDTTSIQAYIDTGDDSGAKNYNQLHPINIDYEVWLDGTSYPNLYVKGTVTSERTSPTSDLYLLLESTLITFNNDEMNYFTWGQIFGENTSGNIVFQPSEFNLNDDSVSFNLNSNGEVNNVISPSVPYGMLTLTIHTDSTPDEDDYPDNTPSSDDTNTYNPYNGINLLTTTYRLTNSQLTALGNFLWSSTYKDNILDVNSHPLENVVSLKAMPYVDDSTDNKEIKIGNVNSGINGSKLSDSNTFTQIINTFFIPRIFNNFLDYTNRLIKIFLPFIGFKELDPKVVVGNTIQIKYIFDVVYGTCLAVISVKSNGVFNTIACYEGSCGIDIPLTSTNRAEIENGYINGAINVLGNVATGNVGGAVSGVFNTFTQDFHSESTGVGNPSLMAKMTRMCFIVFQQPKNFNPIGYDKSIGNLCYLNKKLRTLSGFTVVENFKCDDINLTEDERSELKNLMEGGVYL